MKRSETSLPKQSARGAFHQAARRVQSQIDIGLERARTCVRDGTPYDLGGKTPDGIDCSGLITYAYPMLPDGAANQHESMRHWLLDQTELRFANVGDIIFLTKGENPDVISHVCVIHRKIQSYLCITHASERAGRVINDEISIYSRTYRDQYSVASIGSVRPYMFRYFLENEIAHLTRALRS